MSLAAKQHSYSLCCIEAFHEFEAPCENEGPRDFQTSVVFCPLTLRSTHSHPRLIQLELKD